MKTSHHTADNIAVYMYHHISAQPDSLSVTARRFEQQIRGLACDGYTSLGAEDFAAFMRGEPMPKKSVLITFDDGYLDNWVYAHPVLQRYGFKAVLFTITGLIGDGPVRPHAGQGKEFPALYSHKESKQRMFGPEPDSVMLRWEEIHEMLKAGTFEIHSHTHTHKRWDTLCSSVEEKTQRLHDDLLASRDTLNSRLGRASGHLCWPQGYFDADYQRVANALGFDHLYTTDAYGQNKPGQSSSHIYRFAVRNRSDGWLRRRTWLASHPTFGPLYNNWKRRPA